MPERIAAFLRGMNLGGRRISNGDLCAAFAAIGFADPVAFRASGNVAFSGEASDLDDVRRQVETGLADRLGYPVPAFLRTGGQVRAIAAHRPFPPAVVSASVGKLQVILLGDALGAEAREAVQALSTADDRLAVDGTELYWLPKGGVSESELDLKALDAAIGPGTQRTKGTIELMAAKHFPAP